MASLADAQPPIALGALDGRYRAAAAPLVDHLSEAALNRERVRVEVEWLIHQTVHGVIPGVRALRDDEVEALRGVVEAFGPEQVAELAEIERVTVHDVKAVEYFLKRRLSGIAPAPEDRGLAELVHFGCTSEDINNLSYALMVKGAVEQVWLPRATEVVEQVSGMARELRDVPLLAHTHGQPATPTTMGKELAVLAFRLGRQLRRVERQEYLGKFNGATGTFGAHAAALPDVDWPTVSREFVEGLGLTWNPLTTQIESHDWQAELYADIARFNRILHNLCTDVWTYISMGYFAQVRGQGTVGSSTMPHKVNPLLALDNVARGLAGLDAVPEAMAADLEANWEVLGEPIQSAMRALGARGVPGMEEPYERLKELTRGRRIDGDDLRAFVRGLHLPEEVEERFLALTPQTYTALASRLVDDYLT
jgi:adenylosuccinate lyase